MSTQCFFRNVCAGAAISLLLAGVAGAQVGAPEITEKPIEGQLDIMQGTAIKLGSASPPEGYQPEAFEWEIVRGHGGVLYGDDQAQVVFQAPEITGDLELFVIRLTVTYGALEPAHTTIHLRVHRETPELPAEAASQKSIEEVMSDYYRRESDAREANRRRVEANRPRVVSQTTYRGFSGGYGYGGPGWGWGYGWGWPARYPVFVPIVVPPPGIDWGPGDIGWDQPVAIPYDDLATTFPEHIADDYLPQDFPGAAVPNGEGTAGGPPADFIVFPSGAVRDLDDDAMEPDIYIDVEEDFSEPMGEPDSGFDDVEP